MNTTLDSPAVLEHELTILKNEIGLKSNDFDDAAEKWFAVKPQKEREWAEEYVRTDGPSHVRKAAANGFVARDEWGVLEGRYIALKAKQRALEAQAVICESLLRAQSSIR